MIPQVFRDKTQKEFSISSGVLSFFIGILGGIAFVYLGISASMMLPLVILLKIVKDYKTGIASMLLAIASPISIIPIYNYYKDGDLDLVVGISAFLGWSGPPSPSGRLLITLL